MNKAEKLASQSEALAADRLEMEGYEWCVDVDVQLRLDAAELRRLSAENAELRARLDAIYSTEPVAWINYSALTGNRRLDFGCESEIASTPLIPLPEKS
jgi:hypothetical protein